MRSLLSQQRRRQRQRQQQQQQRRQRMEVQRGRGQRQQRQQQEVRQQAQRGQIKRRRRKRERSDPSHVKILNPPTQHPLRCANFRLSFPLNLLLEASSTNPRLCCPAPASTTRAVFVSDTSQTYHLHSPSILLQQVVHYFAAIRAYIILQLHPQPAPLSRTLRYQPHSKV